MEKLERKLKKGFVYQSTENHDDVKTLDFQRAGGVEVMSRNFADMALGAG